MFAPAQWEPPKFPYARITSLSLTGLFFDNVFGGPL